MVMRGRRASPTPSPWEREFSNRIARFQARVSTPDHGIALSIKIRVAAGCFHREHSPAAYRLIDRAVATADARGAELFDIIEHESGPELLLWVAFATAGISFTTAVINAVVAILKARSEGIKAGDTPKEPLEIIVRTLDQGERVVEEKVLRLHPEDPVHTEFVHKALTSAAERLLPQPPAKPPTKRRHPKRRR